MAIFHEAALGVRRIVRGGLTLAVLAAIIPLSGGCQPNDNPGGGSSGAGRVAAGGPACPRPQASIGVQPQFNAQEQEVRALRRQGFQGDFFAQIDLARRYSGRDAQEKNLADPVESAVWYEMALSNPDGYAPIIARGDHKKGNRGGAGNKLNDCRAAERRGAYLAMDRMLDRMSSDERQQVRDRVIYVLSSQGAAGFRTLARLHDSAFGPFGDPTDGSPVDPRDLNQVKPPAAATLFTRNDVDVYLYNYLAAQAGDVAGYVMLKDFEKSSVERASLGSDAEAKARRWVPPYEFYPPLAPDSGVPHSDEALTLGEAEGVALARIDELPFQHIGAALAYLRVIPQPVSSLNQLSPGDVQTFQAMLGRPTTGVFTSLEKVRAIQYAAVNGSARSQLALAVMYAEGVGVARDYARAFHWFAEADKQGSPEAKYAMSTYFSLGVSGVADQDKASAVSYQIDGALAGFKPSAQRLREVLAQVARTPRRPTEGNYR
ncbi:tetratricopeptide repeat protein [Phenylobacterium sp.]|uniref:tetratricopeptide repeat protein n=1 Tax=Phenylobacterium sp. TaxID=1871053 RepID=UPI00271BF53A|nr:tetratricopeptide repeat protein [Phenylobacterium sp.]MDO8801418.1 tetratricopeptide repeat protein [Phenylobacterium sp.]